MVFLLTVQTKVPANSQYQLRAMQVSKSDYFSPSIRYALINAENARAELFLSSPAQIADS